MKTEEFYRMWILNERDQDTIIDCLNEFAEHQNKELIESLPELLSEFLVYINKHETIRKGSYKQIAENFLNKKK